MQDMIINLMEQFGYLGVFLLITVENVFPPIPSEVILLFGGFMTTKSELTILGVIIASTIGSLVGAIILYYVGKILNKDRLMRLVDGKIGRILHLNGNDINRANDWFLTKGNKTVFFCRFIPILRSLISIPAGISSMNIPKFLTYTIIGSLIWNTVLVYLGNFTGSKWESILHIFDAYSNVVLVVLIILFIVGAIVFYNKKSKKKRA